VAFGDKSESTFKDKNGKWEIVERGKKGVKPYIILEQEVPENRKKHNRWYIVLGRFFQYAQAAYGLSAAWNPLDQIPFYNKQELEAFKKDFITTKELNEILTAALEYGEKGRVGRQYYNLLLAYAMTGARKGEVLCWRWQDHIDFENNRVLLVSHKGGKSRERREDWQIMRPELREALGWQKETNPDKSANAYVFQVRGPSWRGRKEYGGPMKYNSQLMNRIMERVRANIEGDEEKKNLFKNGNGRLKKVTLHSLKHYFCTQLGKQLGKETASGGIISVTDLTKRSRHRDPKIFFETYCHAEESGSEVMDAAFDDVEFAK
jgi:integrase